MSSEDDFILRTSECNFNLNIKIWTLTYINVQGEYISCSFVTSKTFYN